MKSFLRHMRALGRRGYRWFGNNRHRLPRAIRGTLLTFIFFASASLLQDGLKGEDLLTKGLIRDLLIRWVGYDPATNQISLLLVLMVLLLVSGILLYLVLPSRPPVRTVSQLEKVPPHKVLIYSVSATKEKIEDLGNGSIEVTASRNQNFCLPQELRTLLPDSQGDSRVTQEVTHRFLLASTFEEAISQFKGSNIQQFLRAIQPHTSTLERAYLVGSPESTCLLSALADVLLRFCPKVKTKEENIVLIRNCNFNNVDELYRTFGECVRTAKDSPGGYDESDIIIDVTGGQKPTSIAGSLSTLHNHVKFQYVETTSPFAVKSYELILELKMSAGNSDG